MATVLVVEDEPTLRASMVRGLSKLNGVSVLAAGSVDEACAIVSAAVPDLVITDLNLPDRSGIEVIAELDRVGARVPVVIASAWLSSYALPERPDIVLLEKPVALSRLREVVVERLGLRGTSAPFSLADYVQLAGMGRRSVCLDVARDGKRVGRVVIHRGEAWRAEDDLGDGPPALYRLLDTHGVTVSAHAVTTEPARNLEGSCEALLLDHYRRLDEANSGRPNTATRASASPARASDRSPRTPSDPPATSGAWLSWPPQTVAPPAARIVPAPVAESFDVLYARGVEALLDRRYPEALAAFEAAAKQGSTPSLVANLARLRAMGYGS